MSNRFPALCEQCGYGGAIAEMNPVTMQEYLFCPCCGWIQYDQIVRDERGHPILKDGHTQNETVTEPGFGAYWCVKKSGEGEMGRWGADPIYDLEDFKNTISKGPYDLNKCYLTRWNPETEKVEVLYGEAFYREMRGE
jgi:hypothetical protein